MISLGGRHRSDSASRWCVCRAIHDRALIDLSWASSHLEGNTYSRLDARELIEQGRIAKGKDAVETQTILNRKVAMELLVDNVDSVGLDRFTLRNLLSALSENLLLNLTDEGRLRQLGVEIAKSVYHPLTVPTQIEGFADICLACNSGYCQQSHQEAAGTDCESCPPVSRVSV